MRGQYLFLNPLIASIVGESSALFPTFLDNHSTRVVAAKITKMINATFTIYFTLSSEG